MPVVTVHLASALICFANQCYPALVGPSTPQGTYQLQRAATPAPGYGGDVLAFARSKDGGVFAVHRVWELKPKQLRRWRLTEGFTEDRRSVTDGCINVMPDVYQKLVDCCSKSTIVIQND